MKIGIIYSLPSRRILATKYGGADEDSKLIAEFVARGIKYKGYECEIYPISEDNIAEISQVKADVIFNLIEWCGQDIYLAKKAFSELRKLNIPVTGSDEKRFVLTGDKAALKKVLIDNKINTPKGMELKTGEEKLINFNFPVIVKPSCEHCSMGLSYDSIAQNEEEVRKIAQKQIETFKQPALAEEFIKGREFMVYLLEENSNVRVLPIEEVIFKTDNPLPFQTFETKWDEKSPDYNSTDVVIAKLTGQEQNEIEEVAKKTFITLGIRGYGRFDMRLKDGKAFILEANANPSVYDGETIMEDINSEVIWGIKFPDYLEAIVKSAQDHFDKGENV